MVRLVSVVITTKNEEQHIEHCLRSLTAQTYGSMEIIVVDNDSSDRTKKIAKQFTEKVENYGPERSAQRNRGMLEIASGDFLLYLDADMIVAPGLVSACVREIDRKECIALYIPEIVLGRTFFGKVRRFERTFYDGTVIDAARFIRSDVFREVDGFDETLTGVEDWDLDKKLRRIGEVSLLESTASDGILLNWPLSDHVENRGISAGEYGAVIFHNEAEFALRQYLRKKTYYSRWFSDYVEKWGAQDQDVKRQIGFAYRFFGVFVEHGKWRQLLRRPLLAAGIYVLRGLVGAAFLWAKLTGAWGKPRRPA